MAEIQITANSCPSEKPPLSNTKPLGSIRRLYLWGFTVLALWMVLFSLGLLVETVDYRMYLSPRSVSKQLGESDAKSLSPQSKLLYELYKPIPEKDGTIAQAAMVDSGKRLDEFYGPYPQRFFNYCWAGIVCLFCFTPTNIAFLTLCAGVAGGCASNIALASMPEHMRRDLEKSNPLRMSYLQEHPLGASLRGFVVFLCIIAGLYVAIEDPFRDPSPAQYLRLAGLLSALAFMVGYDPSRIEDWLRLVPNPGGSAQGKQPLVNIEARSGDDTNIRLETPKEVNPQGKASRKKEAAFPNNPR